MLQSHNNRYRAMTTIKNKSDGNKYLARVFLFPLFFILASTLHAQETDWRMFVEQLAEEEESKGNAIENMYQELLYLENSPMNLNSVSRNELERFPLLSLEEINSLVNFLEKNRPIYTVYELRNVRSEEHTSEL